MDPQLRVDDRGLTRAARPAVPSALRLVLAVAAVLIAVFIAILISAPPASADVDAQGTDLVVGSGAARCEVDGRQVAQTFSIVNSSPSAKILDFRLSFLDRSDLDPITGLATTEAQVTVFYEGGPLTAILESGGRIVSTLTTTAFCAPPPLSIDTGRIELKKYCLASQLVYEVGARSQAAGGSEPVVVTVGTETFIVPAGESRFSRLLFVRAEPAVPGDRFVAVRGDEVLVDVVDVDFACEQVPLNIDVSVSVECRAAAVPGAVVVTVTNRREVAADVLVDVTPSSVEPLKFNLAEGGTQTLARSGRLDGTYTVTSRIGPVVIDEQVVEVSCVEPVAAAEIDSYCADGNGVIATTVTGAEPDGSSIVFAVSGLQPRVVDVAPGQTTVLRRTGRPDGRYDVLVLDGRAELASAVIEIACDPRVLASPLIVESSVDCASPRIIVALTNTSAEPVAYSIDIMGVQADPLTGTVEAGEQVTRLRTGRRDGLYTVMTSADGVLVSTEQVQVRCAPRTTGQGGLVSYCVGGNGVIEATLIGGRVGGSTFVLQVSGLSDRVVQVPRGDTQITRRTGRPDGLYVVVLDVDGFRIHARITIACDAVGRAASDSRSAATGQDIPPSMEMTWPVTHAAPGEQR